MKYLSNQPFTIAVSSPRKKSLFGEYVRTERDIIRDNKTPHEYEGGSMCGLCGLGEQALIHCKHPFDKRMVKVKEFVKDGKRLVMPEGDFCGVCNAEVDNELPYVH